MVFCWCHLEKLDSSVAFKESDSVINVGLFSEQFHERATYFPVSLCRKKLSRYTFSPAGCCHVLSGPLMYLKHIM